MSVHVVTMVVIDFSFVDPSQAQKHLVGDFPNSKKRGACSKCTIGDQVWNMSLEPALRHGKTATEIATPIFSRSPTMLRNVITGDVAYCLGEDR